MEYIDNIIFFDTDEEFEVFAIKPEYVYKTIRNGVSTYDLDYTDCYNDAITNNKQFCFRNTDSKIAKRNAVSINAVTKPISNILPYNIYEHCSKHNK